MFISAHAVLYGDTTFKHTTSLLDMYDDAVLYYGTSCLLVYNSLR